MVKFCHICAKSKTVKWEPKQEAQNESQDLPQEGEETDPKQEQEELTSTSPASEQNSDDDTIDALWRNAESSVVQAAVAVGGTVSPQPSQTSTSTANIPPSSGIAFAVPCLPQNRDNSESMCAAHFG